MSDQLETAAAGRLQTAGQGCALSRSMEQGPAMPIRNAIVKIPALVVVLLALLCGACNPPEHPASENPPHVVLVKPSGSDVPLDAKIQIVFSKKMHRDCVSDRTLYLLATDATKDSALLADAKSPPLSDSRIEDHGVEAKIVLSSDGKVVTITPANRLAGETTYTVIATSDLCDATGRRPLNVSGWSGSLRSYKYGQTFFYYFKTQPVPPSAALVSPRNGDLEVPSCMKEITIKFSGLVDHATVKAAGNVRVTSPAGEVTIGKLEVTDKQDKAGKYTSATLTISGLKAGESYQVLVKGVCSAASKQSCIGTSPKMEFSTGTTVPKVPTITADPQAECLYRSCTLTWTTDAPSDSMGTVGGNSFTDRSAVTSHRLTIRGLKPNLDHTFIVVSRDVCGRPSAEKQVVGKTRSGDPRVVEVQAVSKSVVPNGHFIEIANAADQAGGDLDLSELLINEGTKDQPGTQDSRALTPHDHWYPKGSMVLKPGEVAVVVESDCAASCALGDLTGRVVLTVTSPSDSSKRWSTVMTYLNREKTIFLMAKDGTILDTADPSIVARCASISEKERGQWPPDRPLAKCVPGGENLANNWCLETDLKGSPGQANNLTCK